MKIITGEENDNENEIYFKLMRFMNKYEKINFLGVFVKTK